MKRIAMLLFCTIGASIVTNAQTGAKTTSPRHKIIAITNCVSDGHTYNPADSFSYTYSGNRDGFAYPSDYSWTYSGNFDTATHYVYSGIAGCYQLADRTMQGYDGNGNTLNHIKQTYDSVAGTWTNFKMTTYTYDAHNNMQTMTNALWGVPKGGGPARWENSYMYRYIYDTANNLVSDTMLFADTTVWLSYDADLFLYDAHHNVTKQFSFTNYTGSWDTSTIIRHWLNAGYKPDSIINIAKTPGGWQANFAEKFTYDASYNMLTDTQINRLTPVTLNIYTYSGGYVASHENRNNKGYTIPPTWTNVSYKVLAYDASNNLVNVINENWNPSFSMYVNANNDTNTFSNFNKITTYTTTSWNITKKIWEQQNGIDAQSRYYYDTLPGLYTSSLANTAVSINLYPNPATDNLSIEIKQANAHTAILAIYDLSGRLYRQWSVSAIADYRGAIPVTTLPAGNYILSVRNDNEQYAKQFSVVH